MAKNCMPEENDGLEAFRTASFGRESEKPYSQPSALPQNYKISSTTNSGDSNPGSRPFEPPYWTVKRRMTAVIAGAAIVGAAYFGNQPKQDKPPDVIIELNTAEFSKYQNRFERLYDDLAGSRRIVMRAIPVPEGLSLPGDGVGSGAFAFDIENDGIDEIYLQEGCGSGGCSGSVYKRSESGQGFDKIVNEPVHYISRRSDNGKPVLISSGKKYLPGGGFCLSETEYIWNGRSFDKGESFIAPEDFSQITRPIGVFFNGRNPAKTSEFLAALKSDIGTYDALRALLQFQAGPGFTMPRGSEYVEYVRQYAIELEKVRPGLGEKALTRYSEDPEGFFAALYGHSLDPAFLDISSPKSIVAASIGLTIKGLGKSPNRDWRRHMEFWDRAQGHMGFLTAYKKASGDYPQTEEQLWSAMNNVVREDRLRDSPKSRIQTQRGFDTVSGSSTESQTFSPGKVTGNPNYNTPDTQQGLIPSQGRQNLDQNLSKAADDARRGIGQGMDKAKEIFGSIFKPKEKK